MKQLVIMPGGFHPFHAGHAALYNSAREAFPGADVYVAATNDTSTRPFPFAVKEKLAQLAGVAPRRFVQVKSPFRAEEIVHKFDPNNTQLIFVRSEKDAGSQPRPGGTKKDGTPSYLQPYDDASDQPLSQQAYMAYLPTVEFGTGMTSATEIRGAWPRLNEKRKTALVMSLYPKTQSNPKLAATVVKLLDTAMGTELNEFSAQNLVGGMTAGYQRRENQPVDENQGWAATYEDSFGRNIYFQVPAEKLPLAQAVKQSINFHPTNKNGVWKFSVMKNQRPDSVQGIIGKLEQMFGSSVNIDQLRESNSKEFILYVNGKPAAKYKDQQQALRDIKLVKKKYPAAHLELKHEVCAMQTVQQVNEGESILEVLKPDAFKALQQAKQNIEQNRQQEIDQWAQDFQANTASKFAPRPRTVASTPAPVAQPGEKHSVLKARLAQLDQAIKKQQQLDALTQKLEYKGLLTPAMQQDLDTRMYVRGAAADNYQALNQKLDRALEIATNRLRTNKLAFKEDADYIEEACKI